VGRASSSLDRTGYHIEKGLFETPGFLLSKEALRVIFEAFAALAFPVKAHHNPLRHEKFFCPGAKRPL
jgi:hypothetical protein